MVNHLSFEMLSRLVDDRGSISEEASARRHMVRCARCRSELEWLQRIQNPPGPMTRFEVGSDSVDERSERSERSDLFSLLRKV